MNATLNGHAHVQRTNKEFDAQREALEPNVSTLYSQVQTAMRDYRGHKQALARVLYLCHGKNVMPLALVERKVSEQIERELAQQLVFFASRPAAHDAGEDA